METYIFIVLLCTHYFADFICQPRWMAEGKSSNFTILLAHCALYAGLFVVPMVFIFEAGKYNISGAWVASFCFFLITFFLHFIVDFFTSRMTTFFWLRKQMRPFFLTIGADQLLHYLCLIGTYKFILYIF